MKRRRSVVRLPWLGKLLLLLISAATATRAADGMALLVPAYFDPGAASWQPLTTAAARVPLVAIANVFNGPGGNSVALPDYREAISSLRAAGGQVIGYVFTQYGSRPLVTVEAELKRWHELYSLDGFFFDEMANDSSAAHIAYYAELSRFVRALRPAYRIIANPGTNTQEPYLRDTAVDVLVTFENQNGYPTFSPDRWTQKYEPSRFANLLYAIDTATAMSNAVSLAHSKRAGFVYMTDDRGANPWDRLPGYWSEEVTLIESLNREAALTAPGQLALATSVPPLLTIIAHGAVGRHVLEATETFSVWRSASTNLSNNGTSIWQVLNFGSSRFFRLRQD